MKKKTWLVAAISCALLMPAYCALAEDDALTKETVAACEASAKAGKATPQMLVDKVNKACALVEKEGKASFAKFKGKDSEFIFNGTYIWVNDINAVMLMHPIKPKMEGQSLLSFADANGKKFFVEMVNICNDKGAGWIDYMWPKPGEKDPSPKVSYVKKAKCDGADVVVGCGTYDFSMDEVVKSGAK